MTINLKFFLPFMANWQNGISIFSNRNKLVWFQNRTILMVSYFKEFWFNFFQNSHYCSRVCVIVMKSWNNFRKATMFGYFDNSCTVRPWKICPQNLKTLQICGWLNLFHYFWISWKPEDFFSIFSENLWISQSAVFCLDRMSV